MTPQSRHLPRRPLLSAAVMLAATLLNPPAAFSFDNPGHRLVGVVWISPTCGGPQREDATCRAPLAGVEVRLSGDDGRVAASATTDAGGAFAMQAPAGRYQLQVTGTGKMRRCPRQDVTLPLERSGPVNLECDSGMR